MAVKIIANYSKRLGLPGYSSHQFSVSVEKELASSDNVSTEATTLYHTLQKAVDQEMQRTGFVPDADYGSADQAAKLATSKQTPAIADDLTQDRPWKASDKQRDLVFKIVDNSGIEIEVVEAISDEMFGHGDLAELNKIQMSGLINELLSRYGKRERRENGQQSRFKGRTLR
jgi:hypothetical protein